MIYILRSFFLFAILWSWKDRFEVEARWWISCIFFFFFFVCPTDRDDAANGMNGRPYLLRLCNERNRPTRSARGFPSAHTNGHRNLSISPVFSLSLSLAAWSALSRDFPDAFHNQYRRYLSVLKYPKRKKNKNIALLFDSRRALCGSPELPGI